MSDGTVYRNSSFIQVCRDGDDEFIDPGAGQTCEAAGGTQSDLTGVVAMSRGDTHFTAILSDGTIFTSGSSYEGQLGNGTVITSNNTIVQVC